MHVYKLRPLSGILVDFALLSVIYIGNRVEELNAKRISGMKFFHEIV